MGRAEYWNPATQSREPIKAGSIVNDGGLEYTPDDVKVIEDSLGAISTQMAESAQELQNHKNAVDPHSQYTLDSEYNNHVGFGATTSAKGHIEIATNAEVTAGTDTTRAVTPSGLKVELDKKLSISAYTASDILTKLKTVDGINSGLDADFLRGLRIATGTYIGSGVNDRVIAVGFKPFIVFIFGTDYDFSYDHHGFITETLAGIFNYSSSSGYKAGSYFVSNGFYAGYSGASFKNNEKDSKYSWLAIG